MLVVMFKLGVMYSFYLIRVAAPSLLLHDLHCLFTAAVCLVGVAAVVAIAAAAGGEEEEVASMAFTLYTLIQTAILCTNAVAVLHEERFLSKSEYRVAFNKTYVTSFFF